MIDKSETSTPTETKTQQDGTGVCGIVMPISHMSDDYSSSHWLKVRKILETAVIKSGLTPKVVWDNPDLDVIQSKILQNIYENDVIICDLSNLNSNVMLEAGLRLSTKKPTILVTDGETKPPFDIASVEYIPYPKNLEYNEIDLFIKKLSEKILYVSQSGNYKSFVENYQFQVARPSTIEVPGEEYILGQLNEIKSLIKNISNKNNISDYDDKNGIENNTSLRFMFVGVMKDIPEILSSPKIKKYNFSYSIEQNSLIVIVNVYMKDNISSTEIEKFKEIMRINSFYPL